MGSGFLGMERDPWPTAVEASDSDPVVPPKRKIPWIGIICRLAIVVVLAYVVLYILVHAFVHETTNASMRYSPKVRHYVLINPIMPSRPTVKN